MRHTLALVIGTAVCETKRLLLVGDEIHVWSNEWSIARITVVVGDGTIVDEMK